MENHSNDRKHEHPVLFNQSGPAISFKAVNWSRLLGYLKPYRRRMTLAVLALLISSGFSLAFPLVIVRLLNSVTKAKSFAPLNNLALLLGGSSCSRRPSRFYKPTSWPTSGNISFTTKVSSSYVSTKRPSPTSRLNTA